MTGEELVVPATDAETARAMVWTCRLALAVAEQDGAKIQAVVEECNEVPGGQPLLLVTMAGTIASMMSELSGANWRQAMQETIKSVGG